jgi:hypothetical protein
MCVQAPVYVVHVGEFVMCMSLKTFNPMKRLLLKLDIEWHTVGCYFTLNMLLNFLLSVTLTLQLKMSLVGTTLVPLNFN